MAKYNRKGEEIPDPTPAAVPVGFSVPNNWSVNFSQYVRKALNEHAERQEKETFEEANDFDCEEEDEDLEKTPYEEHFDHEENFVNDLALKARQKLAERAKFEQEVPKKKKSSPRRVKSAKADLPEPDVVQDGEDENGDENHENEQYAP